MSSADEVRELDRQVIQDLGVPGVALMETASRAVALAVRAHFGAQAARGVVVVCGPGNNGGDGYTAARWLRSWGLPVSTWPLSEQSRGDAAVNRATAAAMGIPEVDSLGQVGLIVDAVFGTGLDREITGRYASVLQAMSEHPAPVVAVDLPSGLHSDTGVVLGVAVRAAHTVTFGRAKLGMFGEPGADYCGRVEVVDIGLGAAHVEPSAELPEATDLAPLWPRRQPSDHKVRSGHLLVLAGSRAMAGAAVLACRGALASGVGLVTLAAPAGAHSRLAQLPPEVMVLESGKGDLLEPVPMEEVAQRTAVAAGPGLGGGHPLLPALEASLERLWTSAPVPVVFDADAVESALPVQRDDRVVTPHPGEAARVLGLSPPEVVADRFSAARALAQRGPVALLKGRHTLVAGHGRLSINPTGNAVLATGGSGDVLVGVVGALLARGLAARDAARMAAWVHGRAGDLLAAERSQGWTAGDVADALPEAIEELLAHG